MQKVDNGVGGIFFLDVPGGTGKTFLIRLILATIWSQNDNLSSCVVRNSCDIATRRNCPFHFEIAIEHAIHWNSHVQHFQSIQHGKSIAEMLTYCLGWMHNGAQNIVRGSWSIIARFAWKHQTIWERIIITCKRFQANITCNSSIDTSGRNKCLPEILYFVATRKDFKINYKYVCPAAKQSISWDILTSIAGNLEQKGAGWSDLRMNFNAS